METQKVAARPGNPEEDTERVEPLATKPRRAGAASRYPVVGGGIPLEWMAGGTWRLPSGKALAEFALQAGFLAPLMLGLPGRSTSLRGNRPADRKDGK